MRTREFTTVGQNRTRGIRDMTNSHARTHEYTTVGQNRTGEIRDMTNSRVRTLEIPSIIGRAMARCPKCPKCTIQP